MSDAKRRLSMKGPALWVSAVLLFSGAMAHAAPAWQEPKAKLRYLLEITAKPSHSQCGVFVNLPDGGLLSGRPPVPQVMTADGKILESRLLWQNVERGFDLVFESPGAASNVEVYMLDSGKSEFWSPDSSLKPSPILGARPGVESLDAARSLTKFAKSPENVTADPHSGFGPAPFSIGGDLKARPKPGVFYFLAHVVPPRAGDYWIAPHQLNGETETLVNGKKLEPKQEFQAWGGRGENVELTGGLNRIEVFQTAPGSGGYATKMGPTSGLMFLTWKPPGEVMTKTTGRGENIKKAAARVVGSSEIARSGLAAVTAVERKDGAPTASALVEPTMLYWLEGEEALALCTLKALPSANPADTQYTWTLPDKSTAQGAEVSWVFPGFAGSNATLIAKSAKGISKVSLPVYATTFFNTADLNDPDAVESFRTAMSTMLSAAKGVQPDPLLAWSPSFWNMVFRTIDGAKDKAFLEELLMQHAPAVSRALKPDQVAWLQDRLLEPLVTSDPDAALKCIAFFKSAYRDPARLQELKLREAEIGVLSKGDFATALATLAPLASGNTPIAGKAEIRLGDIAFLKGNLNEATSHYAKAQGMARARRNAAPADPTSGLLYEQALNEVAPPKESESPKPATTSSLTERIRAAQDKKGQTKSAALQEVSLSENARTLMKAGYLPEAAAALDAWETEFPLSKVSGDYILRESEWHMKSGNPGRAYPMLAAYCRQIDASSFLPDAVSLLIECSAGLPDANAQTAEIVKGVLGRLKYHPVAPKLEAFLNSAK